MQSLGRNRAEQRTAERSVAVGRHHDQAGFLLTRVLRDVQSSPDCRILERKCLLAALQCRASVFEHGGYVDKPPCFWSAIPCRGNFEDV
jgi:hypothetical protein